MTMERKRLIGLELPALTVSIGAGLTSAVRPASNGGVVFAGVVFGPSTFDLGSRDDLFLAIHQEFFVFADSAICAGIDSALVKPDAADAYRRTDEPVVPASHGRHSSIPI